MTLNKEITGFLPNWLSPDTYLNLNYDSLTTIIWFSLGIQPDGSLIKVSYPPANLINYAHSKGKNVILCINPGYGDSVIDIILSNISIQNIFIHNILNEVTINRFNGIDINFEGFPTNNIVNGQSNRTLYTQFIISLSNSLKTLNSNYRLSVDLPPIDWNNVFNTSILVNYVDNFMIMGYDYHWQLGPTSGAVAPLTSSNGQSVTDSINTYLITIPPNKLSLGVPYYGYEWQTQTQNPDSPTIGSGVAITYNTIPSKISTYGRRWSTIWSSPYYLTGTGQGWYDDIESLKLKYDLVKIKNLSGIGIWALGYDTPSTDLSNLILSSFGDGTITLTSNKTKLIIAAAILSFIAIEVIS